MYDVAHISLTEVPFIQTIIFQINNINHHCIVHLKVKVDGP